MLDALVFVGGEEGLRRGSSCNKRTCCTYFWYSGKLQVFGGVVCGDCL